MDKLAAGGAIILVLSEEYFKSPNCMYELREIYLNNRKEFRKRIFPVVLEKTPLHSPEDQILYIDYWEKKSKKFDNNLDLISKRNVSHDLLSKLKDYDDFAKIIGDLQSLISDMYCQKEKELRKTGFTALIERMFSQPAPDGGGGTDKTGNTANIDQNVTGNGNVFSGSGDIHINNLNINAAKTEHKPEEKPSPKAPTKPGTLFHVPDPPPNYLERDDDLKKFRDALLAKGTQVVGITGKRQHVGVLGMGGLGKSVLAAALARDQAVRAAFPDGIFWLTFGQHPDEARLLELQAGILRHLAPGQQPESLDHGADLLNLALEDRRCLLIADDLWDSCHLRYFRLGGSSSRLLLTTRNAEVIKKAGALPCQIGLLSDPQARKLLAECSGCDENALPDEAAAIVQECGHLPLAIAAVGSMVRDEPAEFWQLALKRLQTARLDKIPANVTIDYEHENLFKVFQVSVEALPPEVQAYYKTLLVFPEDARIPQSVLQLYWKHNCLGDYEPLEIISILVKRSLLTRMNDDFFALHDLLRDYLVFKSGGDLANLHKQLLEAYKAEYPGGWHTIPYEKPYYFHNNWQFHTKIAGEVALASSIANMLIRQQPWFSLIDLQNLLKITDQQLIDFAPFLLQVNKHSDVLAICLKALGDRAKDDAFRLIKERKEENIVTQCLKILREKAKDDAILLIKERNETSILIECFKILGDEAKDKARILLKHSKNRNMLISCLNILGDEAKDDARILLKNSNDEWLSVNCIRILGKEAETEAEMLIKTSKNGFFRQKCRELILSWQDSYGEKSPELACLKKNDSTDETP